MKTTVGEILDHLQDIAPFELQESYDNAGLIVGHKDWEVTGVITCLDSTEAVVQEAIDYGANVIVAHHPIIFAGLKNLTGANYIQRTIMKAIKNDIAIIAIHTNLDNVMRHGVNERIADRLALESTEILAPKADLDHNGHRVGAGVIGYLADPLPVAEFMLYLKDRMELDTLRHTAPTTKEVQRVAVCGGSGSFLLPIAKRRAADVFITGDYKYHDFFDADGDIMIIDIGHYESEKYTVDLLYELISKKFSNFAARRTKIITNPVKYL